MIGDLILAFRQIKVQKSREKAYKRLLGSEPDYTLIREIVNSARYEVVATITFKDGTKLDVRRTDATDRLKDLMSPEQAASW